MGSVILANLLFSLLQDDDDDDDESEEDAGEAAKMEEDAESDDAMVEADDDEDEEEEEFEEVSDVRCSISMRSCTGFHRLHHIIGCGVSHLSVFIM